MGKAVQIEENSRVKDRILAVATDLSARVGLEAVSVRDIASAAQASLSAINYHFGSKTGLLQYLVKRHLDAIGSIRAPMLASLEDSNQPTVREVLRIIFTPTVTLMFGDADQQMSSQFFSRALVTPIPEIQSVIDENVSHLDRIVDLFERCNLGYSRAEIYWRLHFTIGIEHLSFFDMGRYKQLSKGLCGKIGMDELLNRMIDFAEPGWR